MMQLVVTITNTRVDVLVLVNYAMHETLYLNRPNIKYMQDDTTIIIDGTHVKKNDGTQK
jgi:hypothetical protein